MFGQPFYLGHLGRTPVYVSGDIIFLVLLVWMWHGGGGFIVFLVSLISLLLAILFHEGAHAAAARIRGMVGMHIVIGGLGGYCSYHGDRRPGSEAMISLAGPVTNGALAFGAFMLGRHATIPEGVPELLLGSFLVWNLVLAIFNILPIYPHDGGQALLNLARLVLDPVRARRLTLSVSVGTAVAAIAWFVWWSGSLPIFLTIILAFAVFQAFRDLR